MKKILYIGIAVFALGMVSCSKQDVKPNSSSDTVAPIWKSLDINGDDNTDPQSGSSGEGGITDPDPEWDEEIEGVGSN